MGRLSGLKKGASTNATSAESAQADEFIQAAKIDGRNANPSGHSSTRPKVWRSVTFSLDDEIKDEVNRLSLLPSGVRVSKSDVIRAAVKLLSSQGDEAVITFLKALKDDE